MILPLPSLPRYHRAVLVLMVLPGVVLLMWPALSAAEISSEPAARSLDVVPALLQTYCIDCHGPDTQEASLRFDNLDSPFQEPRDHVLWERILEVLSTQKMPPADAELPGEPVRSAAVARLELERQQAVRTIRASRSGYRTRRMTADEYNHTMQALFEVEADFAETLPPDPISTHGYQNDASLLDMSTLQLEQYIEIAREAVQRYVLFAPPDSEPLRYHVEVEDLFYTVKERNKTFDDAQRPLGEAEFQQRRDTNAAVPPAYAPALSPLPFGDLPYEERLRRSQPKLNQQYLPVPRLIPVADIVVRIRAAATPGADDSVPLMRVEAGMAYGDGDGMDARRLGQVDVTASIDEPAIYEFRDRMENVPHPRRPEDAQTIFECLQLFISNVARHDAAIYEVGFGSYDDPDSPTVQRNANRLDRAGRDHATVRQYLDDMATQGVNFLHLDAVEIEITPNYGSSGSAKWLVANGGDGGPDSARNSVRNFLRRFMSEAYRRPISAEDIDNKLALFDLLGRDNPFEESLRETLVSVVASPHFLMLELPPTVPDPDERTTTSNQRATRLSYLLWSAPPDGRLLEFAENGAIDDPVVFQKEAQRLLDDPRSDQFLDSFCSQWLRLDRFELIAVSSDAHPDYDDDLAEASLRETLAWFREVFRSETDVTQLIDSNNAILNARLARHYNLPPLVGQTFQRVSLPPDSPRGGLLTQAATLTMGSDGVDSHPIRRGLWILDRLLHDPPPPPPPNIPGLVNDDPDFESLTLKQRIERHREPGSCRACHQKLDPWGLALESFGATGRWREVIDHGELAGQTLPVELPDGTSVSDVGELKRHLVDHHFDNFSRSLVHHMMTYSLSRPLDLADRADAEGIHEQFRESGYRLRALVLAIVASEAFRN